MIRNHKGQFVSEKQARIVDLQAMAADWKRWAVQAMNKGDRDDVKVCMANRRRCLAEISELYASDPTKG